jgi:hypothetical protein
MAQVYLFIWILVIPVALFAGWRLSRRMRSISQTSRIRLTACLLAVDTLWAIQIFTGWSLAVRIGSGLASCVFFAFYLLSVFALWSCVHSGKGRVVARILSMFLVVPLLPVLLFFSAAGDLSQIFAAADPGYYVVEDGRVSNTATYRMTIESALIGGAAYPAYTLYRNPRWVPLVQKKAANGALQCTPQAARFLPGKDSRTVNLTCAGQLTAEIALE